MQLKKYILYVLFCPIFAMGQNLIPNPSFEITKTPKTTPLYLPADWTNANTGSPDYITSLHTMTWGMPSNYTGYQQARTGKAYMGMVIYVLTTNGTGLYKLREYIQAELQDTLEKDSTYCLQFFLSLADSMRHASRKQLGIYLSDIAPSSNNRFENLPETPQIVVSDTHYISDKTNWLEYNFEYTAKGGELFITIGNFNDTNSVDTMYVGGGNKFEHAGTYYYIDDIYLGHCDSVPQDTFVSLEENNIESGFKVFPNPSGGKIQLSTAEPLASIEVFNLQGQLVQSIAPNQRSWQLPEHRGIYLLKIITSSGRFFTQKIVRQ